MASELTTATLLVTRDAPGSSGDQYQITLSLDGEEIASLAPGESVTRKIATGLHRQRATNTLMRKVVEFDALAGECVRYTAGNRTGFGSTFFASLGAGLLYVKLDREGEAPSG